MEGPESEQSRPKMGDCKNSERGAAHFGKFTDAIMSLARKVLEDVGDDQMKRIFTESVNAQNAPEVKPLKDKRIIRIRQLLIDTPLPYIKRDIEEGFEDVNIDEKFQLLLEMQDKYKDRKTPAWRPPADPHQHMTALRVAEKRQILAKYQILESIKSRQVDQLKDQFKQKTASSDVSRAKTELAETKRKLGMIMNLNKRFAKSHEKTVEQIALKLDEDGEWWNLRST